MKVVVTGSEGFIGKVLCTKLERKKIEVVRIDRQIGIEAKDIGKYLDSSVIAVFHLAAQTSVFNDDLLQIENDNIRTFIKVVEQCNRFQVPLVYASSSTANEGNTTSMYGLSKSFDEKFACIYSKNGKGVRLHNVYGPNPRPGTLLHALLSSDEVTLFNNGNNIRSFTYVEDAAEGLIAALGYNYPLMNVVNYEPVSINDFANIVAKYKEVRIILSTESRDKDRVEQTVDRSLFTIPISYHTVNEGLKCIFKNGK